ncbi:Putative WD40/YVTN repeat-like-containing domain superfamily, sortilin, Sialidase superfamily [Septoria linicola]|uniref:Vacuolar protein sorting/targeting protein 10 n=1 Tax=Septoria linicola TaxID=215465 RepID=A0A9Q9AJF6_9PEZI|nr:putative WD40/YVTN repeat-like-containing domain superfamily, sortilin, Sialidase superfamily [Septoria linicola]USW47031.1 Putative WD40/YVTN repeat-like-containing domain superfamily, sortilin, Sialidase superfamily [Septoria linicola]
MIRQARMLLGLLLVSVLAAAAKDKPDIDAFNFHAAPANLLYFEDSDVVLATNADTLTTFRSDDGGKEWKELDGVKAGEVMEVLKHPYDHHVAVVLGTKKTHWITDDRGKSWRAFESSLHPSLSRPGVTFHATDPKRMLFVAQKRAGFSREDIVYYTKDAFKSEMELLHKDVFSCLWAKSTDIFTTGDDKADLDTVLCIARGQFDFFKSHNRLIMSSDYFDKEEIEPTMSDGRTVEGITNLAAVKGYLVFAAKSERTTEMAMYVSDNTKVWHRAEFGQHKLEEDAYTLLESTNYSMQVDVMTTERSDPMGVLLTSNSNGTFFTKNIEHTNRNDQGFVDFEKMSNIQGIVMVNTVDNWKDVEHKWGTEKKVVSHISFDDGRTWEDLKADGKTLHLHSVTNQRNTGRIFSSPAPGLVMGVGNTGSSLGDYKEGDLYVSNDAGLTWRKALSKPHIYEFGAQGSVLVAVEDAETNKIKWSLNHGEDWESTELEDKFRPLAITTTPDSTSLKFLMIATRKVDSKTEHFTYAISFDGLHEKKCGKDDFEKWPARKNKDGKATCIMGHKQFFQRRKADVKCLVENKDFEDPEEKREDCDCTEEDFECDYNFKREDGKCVNNGPIVPPAGACDGDKKKFKGTSGYRLIPGNTCKGGIDLAKEVERECKETSTPPASGRIAAQVQKFKGKEFIEYYYMESQESNTNNEETVLLRTNEREVWKTHDHGKKWERVLEDEEILAIYPHQYMNDAVYFITPSKKVYYSKNFAHAFSSFDAPEGPNQQQLQVLTFHPQNKDWLIWTGGRDCKSRDDCLTIAHVSRKGGDDWETLLRGVRKCQFVYREDRPKSDQLIYCEQQRVEQDLNSPLDLISSDDWYNHKTEMKRDVVNFATMAEFIVVALRDDKGESLKVDASIDGITFADAQFPPNFKVAHQTAYTVLDSSTHAVFLHVTVNGVEGQEYGSILKSNSNGTSYVLSSAEVNRNKEGYVDFEKMQGLEGVAIINRVANHREVDGGSAKKLQTYITHNDGAAWALLGRPEDPPKEVGKAFECQGRSNQRCNLHLHGYTERKDPRDTYSSPSAVGLMIGTGNVGEFLGSKDAADTFITRDGGITWHMIAEGNWMWEYGDQGSIIVIVKEDEPTGKVMYSLDEGKTWTDYDFGETMVVNDITTVPSDTSRNFLLWGKIGHSIATVNIDFSGMEERSKQCNLDERHPESAESDYTLWSPSHPLSEDNCLFGHVGQYHRKKIASQCYNGKGIEHLHNIASNCSCTRNDFECDFNYQSDSNGACVLVDGLSPPDPEEVCRNNPKLPEFYEVTGYRRIPLTTCQGGRELDKTSTPYYCPGHKAEFDKKHGVSGVGLFFAIVIPIAAAAGIGYWVWKNWDGKFGRIRLGDSGGASFDGDAPWVKIPVMIVSGLVAVVAALPMVIGSLWQTVATRFGRSSGYGYARTYTSRSSFQRGRGDYAVDEDDDAELLGEDSDEDV